ncbi:MAG: alpha/beta hydrolase [Rhodoferax sp.]|jgi:pimeloyl-ACP methyl ester carboxylesterase|nr:alpha/beta hydrolase [Rhodoferax sp.]
MALIYRALLLILAGLLFFFVAGIVAVWAPDRPLPELQARWAQPPSQFVAIDGLQVHLRDEGPRDDPAPIVLLHGTADSLHTWDGWAARLRGQRRVIRFDLPGFGLTGPHAADDYSIEAYVRFVAAVLAQLRLEHVVLGGNSLGGEIAWQTALALPQKVQQLILVDAAGYPAAPREVPLAFRLAGTPAALPLLERLLPRGLVLASLRSVYGDPSRVTPELVDRYYDMALRAGNRRALVQRLQAMAGGVDASARIASLTLPTLVLWGAQDRLIPVAAAQRFSHDIAGATRVVFDGLGHLPQQEDPERTVSEVRRFLGMAP